MGRHQPRPRQARQDQAMAQTLERNMTCIFPWPLQLLTRPDTLFRAHQRLALQSLEG